jgi:hypothetical protein
LEKLFRPYSTVAVNLKSVVENPHEKKNKTLIDTAAATTAARWIVAEIIKERRRL